jgi:hypothetical protein
MLKAVICLALVIHCLALVIHVHAAWAQTAHSLDKVPALLTTPESKNAYAQQMEGKPAPDKLGVHLPAALSAQQITALLLPAGSTAKLNVVGAKPLPGQADRYVAIVCTGGDIPTGPDDPLCTRGQGDDAGPPLQAILGIIEAQSGATPRLVAKPVAVDGMVNWRDTALPSAPDPLDDAKGDAIPPDSFDGFDLASYRIAPDQLAFGLRGAWMDTYSGGGGEYSALYLFTVVDGAVKQILAVPMSAFKDVAGDWHKDQTRDHQITDGANVLIVSAHSTDGHFDLLVKSRVGHSQRLYRWSAAANAYQPAGK